MLKKLQENKQTKKDYLKEKDNLQIYREYHFQKEERSYICPVE